MGSCHGVELSRCQAEGRKGRNTLTVSGTSDCTSADRVEAAPAVPVPVVRIPTADEAQALDDPLDEFSGEGAKEGHDEVLIQTSSEVEAMKLAVTVEVVVGDEMGGCRIVGLPERRALSE